MTPTLPLLLHAKFQSIYSTFGYIYADCYDPYCYHCMDSKLYIAHNRLCHAVCRAMNKYLFFWNEMIVQSNIYIKYELLN